MKREREYKLDARVVREPLWLVRKKRPYRERSKARDEPRVSRLATRTRV